MRKAFRNKKEITLSTTKGLAPSATEGFTTIELLVAITLFIILITLAAATFFQALKTQNVIVKLVASNDNAAQIIEQMAREIRTGAFTTVENPSGTNVLEFTNANGEFVTYNFNQGKSIIEKTVNGSVPKVTTPPGVKVTNLLFILKGTGQGNCAPENKVSTRVTILATFEGPHEIEFNYQTTVSPRTMVALASQHQCQPLGP